MSESRQHKLRYNLKLEFISRFDQWLSEEPRPKYLIRWHLWKKCRPTMLEVKLDG